MHIYEIHQSSQPFLKHAWQVRLEDTVSDSDYYHLRIGNKGEGKTELPMPGSLRFEHSQIGTPPYDNVECHGICWFRWGVNRSGGALSLGQVGRYAANQAITADSAGDVRTFPDSAQFTLYEEVGNIIYILDDAGAAGAAPEGQWGVIPYNDAGEAKIQPDLSVAIANTDTGVIVSVGKVDVLASALERSETFGVVMASSLADNYWGWWLCYGIVTVFIKATTAITQGIGLIGDTAGRLTVSSTSGQDIMLARAIVAASNDIASDKIPVFFDVLWGTPFTTA